MGTWIDVQMHPSSLVSTSWHQDLPRIPHGYFFIDGVPHECADMVLGSACLLGEALVVEFACRSHQSECMAA